MGDRRRAKWLTDLMIERLEVPRGKQVDLFDRGQLGLVLRASYGGARAWRARVPLNGKIKTTTIGRFPAMGVKEARKEAAKIWGDPSTALAHLVTKPRGQTGDQVDEDSLFQNVADEFVRRHVQANNLRSERDIVRIINRELKPRWEGRVFTEIRKSDVTKLLDAVEDRKRGSTGNKVQADMVFAIVRKMMRWYAARVDDYVPPIVSDMKRSKPAEQRRKRVLDDDEIRALWKVTEGDGTLNAFVRTLLLTAQRRGKVNHMKRSDVSRGVWTIPHEKGEKATAGELVLPKMTLAIIEKQPTVAGNPYVFAMKGDGPFDSSTKQKLDLDARLKEIVPNMEPWTYHDLRRTARSLMSRAGVRPDVAERVLGHAIPGVEGVYDRHEYRKEKADALKKLAALISQIVKPRRGKVTSAGKRNKARAS
ncbi:MAG: tyrosine-type recombinase/integrase [Variibacter sp.]